MSDSNIMFEVGMIMAVAFIGAALASRYKQSVILGYIVAGILIGPLISINIGGFSYTGIIHDTTFISAISQLGIILLMFFVGLEFSVTKLRKVQTPAIILSLINIGVNLFTGILLGTALGWPLVDTIFLSAVIAMSCAAVAMKSLMELGRLANPETDFLLGVMVVEDFISAVFLALVGGVFVKTGTDASLTTFLVGGAVFIAIFAVLALVVIPRTIGHLVRMQNDEMFVLFALGMVCFCAAVAEICGVPSMIGAFFLGMTFSETKITERMEQKMAPFRDAFVAVFFLAFGMMIDPLMFPAVIGIVAAAVVLVLIDDVLITAMVSYFMGYTSRQSVAVSTSMCARGAESVLYASVGSRAINVTKGAELYPLAGAFTFIMSALCPVLMRRSNRLADYFSRHMPHFIRYSASVMARTLGKLVQPTKGYRIYKGSRSLVAVLVCFLASMVALIVTTGVLHLIAFGAAVALTAGVWIVLQHTLRPVVKQINYSNLGVIPGHQVRVSRYVASLVAVTLLAAACVAFLFTVFWQSVLVIFLAYFLWSVLLMKITFDRTNMDSAYVQVPRVGRRAGASPAPVFKPEGEEQPRFNHRERWKGF
jgi:CPA2 family monovalent cation:H+ antiporter-2